MRVVPLSRRLLVAALTASATLVAPERTTACSCASPRLERSVVPADGTTGFPVDGTIRVFLTAFPEPLRVALAQEYRLVDARGAILPLDSRVVATRLDLHPHAPLEPGRRYTLEQLYAFASDGVRLDDTQRAQALHDGVPGLRRAWFPALAFETSATAAAPRSPGLLSLRDAKMEFRYGGGDCGPGAALGVAFDLPSSLVESDTLELEVRAPDMPPTLVDTRLSAHSTDAGASDLNCDPDPVTISAGGSVEVRLLALDLSGARIGESPWTPAGGWEHRPLTPEWHAARRARRGVRVAVNLDAWLKVPVVSAEARAPAGPAACPNGLEVMSRVDLAAHGGPWMFQQHSLIVFDGRRGWTALTGGPDGATTDVRQIEATGASAVIRTGLSGFPVAMALGESGPLVVTETYESESQQLVTLRALAPTGVTRWEAPLAPSGSGHGIATGGSVVLVTWTGGDDIMSPLLSWALFREADGVAIGAPVTSAQVVNLNGSAVATWVDGHFLVAWSDGSRGGVPRDTVHVLTVSSTTGVAGSLSSLPAHSDGPLDVATAGARVGLVSASHGQIEWTLLSASGAVEHAPVLLSVGVGGMDNRKPRVTFRDDLFAVSWEAFPTRATFAAVVDASGAVSPATDLDPTHDSSTALAIATPGQTFLASYTLGHEGHAIMATLRCRASAAPGTPQQIGAP